MSLLTAARASGLGRRCESSPFFFICIHYQNNITLCILLAQPANGNKVFLGISNCATGTHILTSVKLKFTAHMHLLKNGKFIPIISHMYFHSINLFSHHFDIKTQAVSHCQCVRSVKFPKSSKCPVAKCQRGKLSSKQEMSKQQDILIQFS